MQEPYVFISYSSKDSPFVERLTAKLRDAGIRAWIDRENVPAGQGWPQAVQEGLLHATALISVVSSHSVNSDYVMDEALFFLQKKKRVIPIVIDDQGFENVPLFLQILQLVDFRRAFEPAFHLLLGGLGDLRGSLPLAALEVQSKGYVFISYADEDSEFVADLKSFLGKQGYAYWDYRESERNYQVDYTLELESIIKNAKGTLCVVSPDWKGSRIALRELHFSWEVQTPVFLLKVRDPGPTLAISGLTYIDFTRKRKDGFVQLDGEMRRKGL